MRKTTSKLAATLAVLAGITFAGCDTSGEVELANRQYEGKVTIRLVQEVKRGTSDMYRLEIRDSLGNPLGFMTTYRPLKGKVSLSPEKEYNLKEKGVRLSGTN